MAMPLHGRQGLHNRSSLDRVHPSDQSQLTRSPQAAQDGHDLLGTFVLTPHGLHHPQALSALKVETGLLHCH